jgi:LacI family transcriptional regulator
LDWLIQESIHFSILGNNVQGEWRPEKCDVVWFDDQLGAYELTRHLLTLGHRHIWFVGNCQLPWFSRRYEGYRRAMAEANLSRISVKSRRRRICKWAIWERNPY